MVDAEKLEMLSVSQAALAAERVELGAKVSPVFVSWDEYGTRYRLIAVPIGRAFSELVRQEVGANEESALVTLWMGDRGTTALFQMAGGHLSDGLVTSRLGVIGEDLAAIAPKLRALLVRPA